MPTKKTTPESFSVSKTCVCDQYGLTCTPTEDLFWFTKTKGGWEVQLGKDSSPQLSPFSDKDIELLVSNCRVKQGNSLHFALRKQELEKFLELDEPDLEKLSKQKFLEVTATVIRELVTLENRLEKIEGVFKRLQASRLLRLCAEYKGTVVQLHDVLLQYAEKSAPVSYKRVLERLVEEKPNLRKLVEELTSAEMESRQAIPFLYKRTEEEEPTTWQKLPHKRLSALLAPKLNVRALETLLLSHIDYVRNLTNDLTNAKMAAAPRTQAKKVPFSTVQKLEQVVRVLQSLDFGQDPTALIPVLERARKQLLELSVEPTDVELAIENLATNVTKAKNYIFGPSGRGSGKGAIGDLQVLIGRNQ